MLRESLNFHLIRHRLQFTNIQKVYYSMKTTLLIDPKSMFLLPEALSHTEKRKACQWPIKVLKFFLSLQLQLPSTPFSRLQSIMGNGVWQPEQSEAGQGPAVEPTSQRRAALGMMYTLTALLSGMVPSTAASDGETPSTPSDGPEDEDEPEGPEEPEQDELYASRRRTWM